MISQALQRILIQIRRSFTVINTTIALITGLCLGLVFSIGQSFYASLGMLSFKDAPLWMRGIGYGCAITIAIYAILCIWNWYCSRNATGTICNNRFLIWLYNLRPIKRVILFTTVIFILWIPAFLAFYPGNYSSDGPIQVSYFFNEGVVDLHWPAAHTLLLAGFMWLGNVIFGSYNAGISLFCLTQALALAFALSYSASKAISWNAPIWLVLLVNSIMVFNPVIQAYAMTTAKDSLFSVFFLLSMVMIVDMLREPDKLTKTPFLIQLTLIMLGMCLMRKQGLYVILIVIVIMLPLMKRWRQRLGALLSFALVLILSMAFSGIVNITTTTRADSAREMLSVPSQQIVRTYMYSYGTLSDEQIKDIGTYYDLKALEAGRTTDKPWDTTPIGMFYDTDRGAGYLAPISDPAKGALLDDAVNTDPAGYISMYFSVMNGHLSDYVRAFLWGNIGYLYPTSSAANRWTGLSPWNEFGKTIDAGGSTNQVSDYNQTTKLPSYLRWIHTGTWDMFPKQRILTYWVSPALPFLVLVLSFILLLKNTKNRRLLLAWSFPFFYLATLSLAPVMCVRYVVPLFFAIPTLLSIPLVRSWRENDI